jgi:hypothetical protein
MKKKSYSSISNPHPKLYFAVLMTRKTGGFSFPKTPLWYFAEGSLAIRLVTDEHTGRIYAVVSSISAAKARSFVNKLAARYNVRPSKLVVLSTVRTFIPGSNPLLASRTLNPPFYETGAASEHPNVKSGREPMTGQTVERSENNNRLPLAAPFLDYRRAQPVMNDEPTLYVVSRDGNVATFDKARAWNALAMIGVQAGRAHQIISRLFETAQMLSLNTVSSRELVEFFASELRDIDENLARKYIGMVSTGRITQSGVPLSRGDIRKLVLAELGNYGLKASKQHLKKLSGDIFDAVQRLAQTSEGDEFAVGGSIISALVRARLDNMPFFRSIRRKGKERVVEGLKKELLEITEGVESLLSDLDSSDSRVQLYMDVLRRCMEKLTQAFLLKNGVLPSWSLERDVSTVLTLRLANPKFREYLRKTVGLLAKSKANTHTILEFVSMAREFSSSLL